MPCLIGDREPGLVRVSSLGFARCDLLLVGHADARDAARVRVVAELVVKALLASRRAIEG